MPDLEDRIAALEATASANKTDFDAINGRLETLENTVRAMGDGVAAMTPANVADISEAVADIKSKANDFYQRVFGDVLFPTTPPAEPSTN